MRKLFAALAVLLCLLSVVSAEAATIKVNGSFADLSDNEDGFRVERKLGSGAFETLATLAANTTAFVDNGPLPMATEVCYRSIAFNALGDSAASPQGCASTPATPSAPGSLTITVVITQP